MGTSVSHISKVGTENSYGENGIYPVKQSVDKEKVYPDPNFSNDQDNSIISLSTMHSSLRVITIILYTFVWLNIAIGISA